MDQIDPGSALLLSVLLAAMTVSFQAIGWYGAATGIGIVTYLLAFAALYNMADRKPKRFDADRIINQYRMAKATYKLYTSKHKMEIEENER